MEIDKNRMPTLLPLTASYKKDASTTIATTNTLSTDKKNVLSSATTENSVTVNKTEFAYAANGSLTSQKDYTTASAFTETAYVYNNTAKPTEVKTIGVKDAAGNLVTSTTGYSNGTIVEKHTYNNRGLPLTITDGKGNKTTIVYDALGRITKVTYPDSSYDSYVYDTIACTVKHTDELGNSFLYKYDRGGNLAEITDIASGNVSLSKKYDSGGNLYREIVYDGTGKYNTTYYYYDNFFRPIETVTKDNAGTTCYRETNAYQFVTGSLLKTTNTIYGDTNSPNIVTTSYKDVMGNITKTGKFLGTTENFDTYTYDYLGNVLTEKSAFATQKGITYSGKWEYDFAGRPVKTYNADGASYTTKYDFLGNKVSQTDFAGTQTTYTYDGLNRLLSEKRPIDASNNSTTRYYYDAAGNITSNQYTNNQVGSVDAWAKTDYEYDTRGRLTYALQYNAR